MHHETRTRWSIGLHMSQLVSEICENRSLAPVLLQEKRQIEGAAETESVPAHARGIRQGHIWEAVEQHWQHDGANGSPRQVRARAMMGAVAKGLVRLGLAQRVRYAFTYSRISFVSGACRCSF